MATSDNSDAVARRRRRLKAWIDTHHSGVQAGFVERTGINQGELSGLLKEKSFGEKKARSLERAAGMPPNWLDSDEDARLPPGAMPVVAPGKRVWVIGNGQGGIPDRIWGDSDYPVGTSDKYAEVATDDPHAFIVAVRGDSMEPRFKEGEYALVEPSAEADLKDDVLVRLKGGETLLKRLLDLRGGVRLGSYNSEDVLTYPFEEIVWIYHVSHALPPRKIKMWVDPVAEQANTWPEQERRRAKQAPLAELEDRRKNNA